MKLAGLALAITLATAPATARKKKPQPDLPPSTTGLIDNVSGLTVNANGQLDHFTGLLIGKDGRVEQRLKRDDKRPERLAWRLDAKGKTLIPSLIDSHARIIDTGLMLMTLDLSATRSLAEAQTKIAAYARENDSRKWILGRGWSPERWAQNGTPAPLPTAADLDSAVADRPTWLLSSDGEMGWANSAALRAAGITKPTAGPLTGDNLLRMTRTAPAPAPKDRDIAFDKAQKLFLSHGISAVADMGTTIDDWQSFRRAGDRGALRLRISGYADGIAQMITIAGPAPSPWLYDDHLRLTGVHFALDGTQASGTAWTKSPPARKSRIDSTVLRNQMSRAAMDDFQIALTAHGDAAVEEALAAFEEMSATYKGDRRWRLEAPQAMAAADLQRLPSSGVTTILAGPAPATLFQSANAALATAAPGGNLNPFAQMAQMAAAQGDIAPALAAFTRRSAHAAFAETRIGALDPGQHADFLLIDRDIATMAPPDLAQTRILEHWIDGKRVWAESEGESNTLIPESKTAPERSGPPATGGR